MGNYEGLVNRNKLLVVKSLASNWQVTKWLFVGCNKIVQMSESFNSMLVLSGMRIPCYLPRIPRPYYGCSPYPIVYLLCCLFHALYSLLCSLCSAGASLSAPQAPPSALHASVPTAVRHGARHLPSNGAVEQGAGQHEGNASQTTK